MDILKNYVVSTSKTECLTESLSMTWYLQKENNMHYHGQISIKFLSSSLDILRKKIKSKKERFV